MASVGDDLESITERQENELQVLRAIYMDDVKDLRENDAWKIARPPEIQISLGPQESFSNKQVYVCVMFIVKCPPKYPDVTPEIRLESPKGLSKQQVEILNQELKDMCKRLIGEVMILELCQYIQKFLHAHNKPPSQSFYDEMMTTRRIQEERTAREQQRRLEMLKQKEAQSIENEIQKRTEALREEARKRREQLKMNTEARYSTSSDPSTPLKEPFPNMTPIPKDTQQRQRSATSPPEHRVPLTQGAGSHCGHCLKPERRSIEPTIGVYDGRTSTPLATELEPHDCIDNVRTSGIVQIVFNTKQERKIQMGKCLGQSSRGSSVYVGLDSQSGGLVAVSEWVLKWRHINRKLNLHEREEDERESNKYMKQIASLEKETFALLRLSHKHLIHYHAFKYTQESGKLTLHLLMDYAGGGNLATPLRHKEPVQMSMVRCYSGQALDALAYLHNKAVVHKDLRASSLMLDHDGCLRLGDISLTKRLTELVREVNINNHCDHFDEDVSPVIGGRGGKKADIYRLGLLLLSLGQGDQVMDRLPEIPPSLPPEFQDFLTKCLIKDEFHRWSAHQLLDHSFVKTPLYTQPLNPGLGADTVPVTAQQDIAEDDASDEHVIPFIPASDSGSRLQNEFEILKWLGKGGFGDVIKVKNKLDGRYYAIKRIPLNPTKKAFTRKITREVKLLSMLNHENVVRYYNSWIETSTQPVDSDMSSSDPLSSSLSKASFSDSVHKKHRSRNPTNSSTNNQHNRSVAFRNTLGLVDEWEKNAPAVVDGSIEWSVSIDITHRINDEDSSEDEDYVFGASMLPRSDSEDDGIVFEHNSNSDDEVDFSESKKSLLMTNQRSEDDDTDVPTIVPRIQFLYIQMEFCEKSTLRNCIDVGLYEDVNRVWRLFREIVEGLIHIHQQGMIHRDLKPVNIFLDSNDHVKIGDFGLATTDILTKQQTTLRDMTNPSLVRDLTLSTSSRSEHDESTEDAQEMTGKVGTALYVAPEMTTSCKRTHYSQKVDIYSLGVMFFEMCYHPLPTGMERVKILSNIRDANILMPEDFDDDKLANQTALLCLLLSHDASKRPTAAEILKSEHMPPPQMEEAELNEVLRSTIANPDSKLYKRMIDAIFSQPITPAMDFAYDNELYKASSLFSPKQAMTTMFITDTLERIFKRHSAVNMSMPLLMPKSNLYEGSESYVCFMDHIGGLVALPHDLNVPFARFVARYGINDLKRYTTEVVYRENRVYGLHPKELLACSFDIVTPTTASFVPDAEVISVVFEVIQEFAELQSRNYYLRINHRCLLKGILLYSGVPEELHQEVYSILGDNKNEHQRKTQIQTRLYSLSLTEHTVDTLYHFVETEGVYKSIASILRRITKTKGLASSLTSKGLKEIEAIISHTEALGLKVQAVLTLGLILNVNHYSGAIFQVVRNVHKKNKQTLEVLAAGGRYDNLVAKFRKPGSGVSFQCVVGISIAIDRIVAALSDHRASVSPPCDVLVCSLGANAYLKEKLSLLRDLWSVGISADIVHDCTLSLEEIQDQCKKSGVSNFVIIKESEVKLRSIEKDKVQERRLHVHDLPSYLHYKLQVSAQETIELANSQSSKSSSSANQLTSDNSVAKETREGVGSMRHHFNIFFIHQDSNNKTGKNTRRNMESQIYSNISSCLTSISTKCHIEIVVMDLTCQVLKTMAAFLELDEDEKAFSGSIGPIIERHPRHRKYLTKVFDHISEIKFDKHVPVIIMYGSKDDSYRVLL